MEYYGLRYPNPEGRAGGALRDVEDLRGGAVHIAVIAPSVQSANKVAQWQSTQRGYVNGVKVYSGYHSLFDSDEHLPYFPDNRVSYGARGGNQFGKYNKLLVHLSGACNVDTWARYKNWSTLTYGHMGPEIRRLHETYDFPYRLLTKAEFDRGLLGFITHQRLDPDRRKDPGAKEDGSGDFDFEYLFGIAQGDSPEKPDPREEDIVRPIKHGDTGVEVRQLTHLINSIIVYTGGWHTDAGPLLPIRDTYDNDLAERVQHAIWRVEGWVFHHPLYAEEEGGSRVTIQTLAYLVDAARGIRSQQYKVGPAPVAVTRKVNVEDAQSCALAVREDAPPADGVVLA